MKLYIAGPIVNLDPKESLRRFNFIERRLKYEGFDTFNPRTESEALLARGVTEHEWRRVGLLAMLECDGVALTVHEVSSTGTSLEMMVAQLTGLHVKYWTDWTPKRGATL